MRAPLELQARNTEGLSVVLVNWNGGNLLVRTLESLERELWAWPAGAVQIVLLDNASTDGSALAAARRFPGIRLLQNDRNLGFAAAANQGLAASRGDLVLFLNPDVEVRAGTISRCIEYLCQERGIAVVGCRLLNPDMTHQRSVENFHSLTGLVLDNLLSLPPLGRLPLARRRARFACARTGDVDWVHGAFMLCRRRPLEAVGGFDTDYFMYAEDMDLCYRLRQRGYRVAYIDEVAVVHVGQVSSRQLFGAGRGTQILRSTLLFLAKHRGFASATAFRVLAGASFLLRAACAAILALIQDREQHAARAAAYWRRVLVCAGLGRREA